MGAAAAVSVAGGRYVFNGGQAPAAVTEKRREDEVQVAALVAKGTPAIKLIYDDGDQHASFKRALASNGADALNRSASWASTTRCRSSPRCASRR